MPKPSFIWSRKKKKKWACYLDVIVSLDLMIEETSCPALGQTPVRPAMTKKNSLSSISNCKVEKQHSGQGLY
jgi:hypothetical protein